MNRRDPIAYKWITECALHNTDNSTAAIALTPSSVSRTCHHCGVAIAPSDQYWIRLLQISWEELCRVPTRLSPLQTSIEDSDVRVNMKLSFAVKNQATLVMSSAPTLLTVR